jgi:putative hydrolase of the HAD superfamily
VIRLITLDFWQTLFADTEDSSSRAHALRLAGLAATLAATGRVYGSGEIAAADARAGEAFEAIWREHRDVAPEDQVRTFLEALDPALPAALDDAAIERIARAYQEPTLTHPPAITAGAVEAVRELRAQGLRLGLISNTGRTPGWVLRQLLGDAGILLSLDILVFSDEARVRKPAAAIFRRVLDEARVAPERAVHVGDDATTDVAGARGVGMRAIHFVPNVAIQEAPADAVLRRFADLPGIVAGLGRP